MMHVLAAAVLAQHEWSIGTLLKLQVGRDKWTITRYKNNYSMDAYCTFRRNGKVVRRFIPHAVPYVYAYRVKIDPGYTVINVEGGGGAYESPTLFAIRKRKLIEMGDPPNINSGGPVIYQGHKDIWLFDNYSNYDHEKIPDQLLMKVDKNLKLHFLRKLGKKGHVPNTMHGDGG